jgi:hypothetical protein
MSNFQTFEPVSSGLPGTGPSIFSASTTDNFATITAANYMNDMAKRVKLNDILYINYVDTSAFPLGEVSTLGAFQVAVSGSNYSLVLLDAGNVTLPVQDNHVPLFDGTTGKIKNSPMIYDNSALQVTRGTVIAGDAGFQGFFQSHPPTTGKGVLNFIAADQDGDFYSSLTNDSFAQATNCVIADPGVANCVIPTITSAGLIAGNTVYPMHVRFTLTYTITPAMLNAGDTILITSTGSQQFQFFDIMMSVGTNFDNTGDKNVRITCGTGGSLQVFATIPAASLKSQQNDRWCSTNVNAPSSPTGIATHTNAGTNVVIQYVPSGGVNYSTGNFLITLDAIQVA